MKRLIVLSILTMAMMAGAASFVNAETGVPDLEKSWVEMAWIGPSSPVLFNVPNGGGAAFFEAYTLDGYVVDATITLYLRDSDDEPVTNYAADNMWLMTNDALGGFAPCFEGTIPDSPTDPDNGVTTWANPLRAGGWSEGQTVVMIDGSPLLSVGLNLRHNSPDIDGNGTVNLTDLPYFVVDFFSINYSFRSDFFYDGQINLSDVPPFAANRNNACPPPIESG